MVAAVLHLSIPVRDLAEARALYEGALGCEVGRVRADRLDVWFYGLQLTLRERPDEVVWPEAHSVRHLGVALDDAEAFESLVERLDRHAVTWLTAPAVHTAVELSGKVGGKVADPSGNIIELEYCDDPAALHGEG